MLLDARGILLRPGQTVAVAERAGNVAMIRTGVIEEIVDDYGKVTIIWTDGYVHGAKVSTISVEGEHVSRPRICVVSS